MEHNGIEWLLYRRVWLKMRLLASQSKHTCLIKSVLGLIVGHATETELLKINQRRMPIEWIKSSMPVFRGKCVSMFVDNENWKCSNDGHCRWISLAYEIVSTLFLHKHFTVNWTLWWKFQKCWCACFGSRAVCVREHHKHREFRDFCRHVRYSTVIEIYDTN